MAYKVDHQRSLLSLLPGKLLAKHLLTTELDSLKEQIQSGEHREYIALMPGLESALAYLDGDLGAIQDLLGSARTDTSPRMLPESQEAPQTVHHARKRTVDAAGLLGSRVIIMGRPSLPAMIVHEFMTHDYELDVNEFMQRLPKEYNLSDNKRGKPILVQAIGNLRKRGLRIVNHGSVYRCHTSVTGEIPGLIAYEQSRRAKRHRDPESPEPQKAAGAAAAANGGASAGEPTRAQVLMQECRANDGFVNLRALAEKYNTTSRFTFHWAMNSLRGKGYEFEKVSDGIFKLTREGNSI